MDWTAGTRVTALVAAGLAMAPGCSIGQGHEPTALQAATSSGGNAGDAVLYWNAIALEAIATDHTGTFGAPDQGGPTRGSRALAITHLAIYDAVNAIDGTHEPYLPVNLDPEILRRAAVDAAVAQASYETLAALYPRQAATFATSLSRALQGIPMGRNEGVMVGHEAAVDILAGRASDGSAGGDTAIYPPTADPPITGQHVPDPLNPDQGLITPGWGKVKTFSGIDVTASGVRAPDPPGLMDPAYTSAFNEAMDLGGDGIITPTERTKEQTEIGIFWGYDGSAKIGTPPRLYNQVVRVIAKQQRNTLVENARLFALANVALADSGIACWDSKYYYNFWRPVVGIRKADLDGNAHRLPGQQQERERLHATLPGLSFRSRHLRCRHLPDLAPLLRHG